MMQFSLAKVKASKGDLQSFTNRLLLEPVFDRTTWLVANYTTLSANQLSLIGFFFGICAAVFFFFQYFIAGAVFYEIMNLFDTFDGRIARLRGQASKYGQYVDWYIGFWITFFLSFGLLSGVYFSTGDMRVWQYGLWFYFFHIIHFVGGNVVGHIVGSQSYYSTVKSTGSAGLFSRIRQFLVRKGYREPFNMTDNQHFIFFLMPITGLFYSLYWVILIGTALHAIVWFFNYRAMLFVIDKQDNDVQERSL